jgi:hypothetical protein
MEAQAPHHLGVHRAVFFGVLALSALIMIWLFWHHPLKTALCTLVLLTGFGLAVRLARWLETDAAQELDEGEQSAP